mmetsp:Transcript_59992/g.186156  ORF Transcript_59992/g.186156 Transcript_59992/m.186156 type:complete len:178 (-) Transcript_59992:187-720(-)
MMAVTSDTALICFRDAEANWVSRCRLLRATGTDLSWEGDGVTLPFALQGGGVNRLEALSSRTAIICSTDCAVLGIHESSITAGPAVQTGDSHVYRWIAAIWEDRSVWCGYYAGCGGCISCGLQQLRDQSLEFGALVDQPFKAGDMDMVSLGEGRVLVCYSSQPSQCRFLTVPTVGGH